MKKISKKLKIIIFVAIILVVIILAMTIIKNIAKHNNIGKQGYLATTENADSNLIASYIKKGITISGITGTLEILDTSDANAREEDVLAGKTFYAGSNDIKTGTMQINDMLKRASTSYNPNSYTGTKTINVETSLGIPADVADKLTINNFVAFSNRANWTRNIAANNITYYTSITSYDSSSHNLTINHLSNYTETVITIVYVYAFWIE